MKFKQFINESEFKIGDSYRVKGIADFEGMRVRLLEELPSNNAKMFKCQIEGSNATINLCACNLVEPHKIESELR